MSAEYDTSTRVLAEWHQQEHLYWYNLAVFRSLVYIVSTRQFDSNWLFQKSARGVVVISPACGHGTPSTQPPVHSQLLGPPQANEALWRTEPKKNAPGARPTARCLCLCHDAACKARPKCSIDLWPSHNTTTTPFTYIHCHTALFYSINLNCLPAWLMAV